jgi:thioesterase domain-containing protein
LGLPPLNLRGAVYGLDSPFVDTPNAFTLPLREVATLYVQEIRRVQPHGPYHVAGWSIGGTYAFEVASQLMQLHKEVVQSLILIDSPCPQILPALPIVTIDLLEAIGVFDPFRASATSAGKGKMPQRIREHFQGSVNSLKGYRPIAMPVGQTPNSVVVMWAKFGVWETVGEEFRCKHQPQTEDGNAASDWIMDSRQRLSVNGWETLLPGVTINYSFITGDHFSIMRKPGIVELGSHIALALGS